MGRRKGGTKHHLLTFGNGAPAAATVTAANRNDITRLLPLLDAVPPVRGRPGRPRRRPGRVQGDRGYNSEPHRRELRRRRVEPLLARRGAPHGSGLGVYRWPVERSLSWLHMNRRLRVRYEKRADVHEALVSLGCAMICWKMLHCDTC